MYYNGSQHLAYFDYCHSTYPPWTNVINGYDNVPREMLREHDEVIMPDEELHCDLFRELLYRFSESGDIVVDFFAGSFSSALAALAGSRKYIGFETNDTRYELGVERLLRKVGLLLEQGQLYAFPELTSDLTKAPIPEEFYPPDIQKLKACGCDLDGANLDARSFNMVIKKSNIQGADLGLFTTVEMKPGTIIGYYWGRNVLADSAELEAYRKSDRILSLYKYQIGEDSKKRHVHIVASKLCSSSYANDPRTIRPPHSPNAYFDERGSIALGYQLVPLVVLEPLVAEDEIYVDYGRSFAIVDLGCEVTPQAEVAATEIVAELPAATVPPPETIANDDACSGCGESLKDGGHKCDICGRANHPWCGTILGEGHGAGVRCLKHNVSSTEV
mgnify:FL=1